MTAHSPISSRPSLLPSAVAEVLEQAALTAGQNALRLRDEGITISAKSGPTDVVTQADHENQALIGRVVEQALPGFVLQGEEQSSWNIGKGKVILCDPVDGTWDFAHGGMDWGVVLGALDEGHPFAGVLCQPMRRSSFRYGANQAVLNGEPFAWRYDPTKPIGISVGAKAHPVLEDRVFPELERAGSKITTFSSAIAAQLAMLRGETSAYIATGERAWDVIGIAAFLIDQCSFVPLVEEGFGWTTPVQPSFVACFDRARAAEIAGVIVRSGFRREMLLSHHAQ